MEEEEFSKLSNIIKTQNNEQLLWILQRYFQKIYGDKIDDFRNPYLYYYRLGLRKQIPSSKFSGILLITKKYNTTNNSFIQDNLSLNYNYFDRYIYYETLRIFKTRVS